MFINCKYSSKTKRKGVRKWFTRTEVIAKFGEANGLAIIGRKLADPFLAAKEVRDHPELPGCADMQQFLILDLDQEVEEEEDIMEHLYRVADKASDSEDDSNDNDSSSGAKKKKDKKNKHKKAY